MKTKGANKLRTLETQDFPYLIASRKFIRTPREYSMEI